MYGKKLIKMLKFSRSSSDEASSVSPPCAVHCEELFLPSAVKKEEDRRLGSNDHHIDPFIAGHIAAQNYFTLRPNIYI